MTSSKFSFFLIILLAASCGGKGSNGSDGSVDTQQREEDTTGGTSGGTTKFDVTLDSELTSAERTSLKSSFNLLENLRINGSSIYGFSKIFGGTRSSNVVNYLERRVNYILSENTNIDSRLMIPTIETARFLDYFALNPSVFVWYKDVYYSDRVLFVISNIPQEVNSSRFGVVQLGNIFTDSDAITQAVTLVHEARHSDCPGGALLSDVVGFTESGRTPQNKKCGQLHTDTICPGSSCDGFAWGPYAIDFIYSLTIFKTCSSCTETQKIQAQTNANQVQGAAFDIIGTLNGVYGEPDMSNSIQVRNDL